VQLLLRDDPVLTIDENGVGAIIDHERLPWSLRKERITFPEFVEWAINRTLSIGRSYAKAILNALRLSQNNRFAVCKACRGLSLSDSYWIKQEGDNKSWAEVNLFANPLALFLTELSLSGNNINFDDGEDAYWLSKPEGQLKIHTPELTTLGANAKGWVRAQDGLFLHKVGRYEIAADQILTALAIPHLTYAISTDEEIKPYLSAERQQWLTGVGEVVVKSRIFTSEAKAMVTFEEFRIFCENFGLNPFTEASAIDREAYLAMQVVDYIISNDDRHEQNWGFFMDNDTGRMVGYVPLFDHDHAFSTRRAILSQTTDRPIALFDAAVVAQKELGCELGGILAMDCPPFLTGEKWQAVRERTERLLPYST
jgi:hypothetical protein